MCYAAFLCLHILILSLPFLISLKVTLTSAMLSKNMIEKAVIANSLTIEGVIKTFTSVIAVSTKMNTERINSILFMLLWDLIKLRSTAYCKRGSKGI